MTDQKDSEESIELIKKLEKKIEKMEKDAKIGLEDQLFFGIIISLIMFLLSIDLNNVSIFFQTMAGFNAELGVKTAEGITYTSLFCLLLSSGTRYYGAVSKEKTAKNWRFYSLQFLFIGINFILLVFITNFTFNSTIIISTAKIPAASVILVILYAAMAFVENKALKFYSYRKIIFKKDSEPIISKLFASLGAGYYLAYLVEFILIVFQFQFHNFRFMITWFLSSVIVFYLITVTVRKDMKQMIKKRLKRTNKKNNQKTIQPRTQKRT